MKRVPTFKSSEFNGERKSCRQLYKNLEDNIMGGEGQIWDKWSKWLTF